MDNASHKEPLAEVCVMNLDNLLNANDQTEMPKMDVTVLMKSETAALIELNSMLPRRNHVDRSKLTSENDARTSAADVEKQIT